MARSRIYRVAARGVARRESDGTSPTIAAGEYIRIFSESEAAYYEERGGFDILTAAQIQLADPGLGSAGARPLPPGKKFALLPPDWISELAKRQKGARSSR